MLGQKSIAKRIAAAVDPTLDPSESKIVSVYLHDPSGAQRLGVTLIESPLSVVIKTWIVTLTDQRVIVHVGNQTNAARSTLAWAGQRDQVSLSSADPSHAPKRLMLSFDGSDAQRFDVPLLWRNEAALFAQNLLT